MKRIILFILTISLFLNVRAQSSIVACEYWMDGDMDAITEVPVSGNEASFAIDVSGLADGMHTLYYRVRDAQGRYSTPNTWLYMKDTALRGSGNDAEPSTIVACEYWMDGDMSNITEIAVDSTQVAFAIDVSGLADGMHTLYYRVRDAQGRYSTPNTWLYMKDTALRGSGNDAEPSTIVACEYWMDGDMSNITEIAVDSTQLSFAIDVSNLTDGMHTLYYRVRDAQGRYSTPNTWLYMKDTALRGSGNDAEPSTIVACEYWMDGGMSNITEIAVDSTQLSFAVDVSSLADGMHTLYYRVRDEEGRYSTTNTWLYMKDTALRGNSGAPRITWYKYWWNNHQDKAERVEVECDTTEFILMRQLYIPDYVKVNGDSCFTSAKLMFMFGNNKGYTSQIDTAEVTFPKNHFTVIYTINGEVYKYKGYALGDSLTIEASPIKEGYTFSGWSEIPETMPAKDVTISGTLTVNTYKVTYMVDGEEYATDSIAYGSVITTIAEPIKEGYTFSGWSDIPDTMPAKDVTLSGTFADNTYKVIYIVDGETHHTDSIAYGSVITMIAEPVKEGYTFSGWSEIPETMPAEDVMITGTFSINTYKLTYTVDGEVYQTDSIIYGTALTAIAEPVKEGYTFSGWSEIPETMPAEDVTVTGTFSINTYRLTYTVDDEVHYTDFIVYGTALTALAEPTKEGYTFSGWSEIPETMPAKDVTITGLFILNARQTDEQGLVYELNATKDAFEVSGFTDDLKSDVVIASELYGLPVSAIKTRALALAENMRTLVIPSSIKSVGKNSLGANEALLIVEWNTTAPVDATCFSRPSIYGNMLVFVSDATTKVSFQGNVIVDGVAEKIVLTDGLPLRNPREFTARSISYSREFTKETRIGVAGGWEAIVLPFDVQTVVSEKRGTMLPVGQADNLTTLPYWMAELQEDGSFVLIDKIAANTPFILEMPNSDEYEDRFNIEGTVTFTAENATVYATTAAKPATQGYTMNGSYEGVESGSYVYALNDEEYTASDGTVYMPGGVFVENSRDVRPFEAYVYGSQASRAPYLRIGGKEGTGIGHVLLFTDEDAWYTLQGIRLSERPHEKGLYIHGGKVVVVK